MPYIGCCGFSRALARYFETFKVVEVQRTFYQPPKVETIRRWREKAGKDFEFTLKAWQLITHPPSSPTYRRTKTKPKDSGFFKPTKEIFNAWERTREVAKGLEAKVIIFQCPASFKPKKEKLRNLRNFFSSIGKDFIHAWEPRGKWAPRVVRDICEELNLIHCVDPFKNRPVWGSFHYYRLHGIQGYRYRYTDDDLKRLSAWCGRDDYVMFNNTNRWEDAKRFREMVKLS